jgi:hypothetical protein
MFTFLVAGLGNDDDAAEDLGHLCRKFGLLRVGKQCFQPETNDPGRARTG